MMRRSLWFVLATVLVAAGAAAPQANAAVSITGLSIEGDDIGRSWSAPTSGFSAPADWDGTNIVSALYLAQAAEGFATIRMGAANGAALALGTYTDATPMGGGSPQLAVGTDPCTSQTASFTILELASTGDTVTKLAFRFSYQCDNMPTARSGEYRYQSTIDFKGPDVAPVTQGLNDGFYFGSVKAGTTSAPQAITVSNRGTAPFTVNGVAMAGTDASAFATSADGCTGVSVAGGASCTINLTVTPPIDGGDIDAVMQFTSTTGRGSFGYRVAAFGLTAASVTLLTPDVVAAPSVLLRAAVTDDADGAPLEFGDALFYVDDVPQTNPSYLNGAFQVPVTIATGTHSVRFTFSCGTCASAEASKTISVLKAAAIEFTAYPEGDLQQGQAMNLSATLSMSGTPVSGSLRVKNVGTGAILGSKAVTSASTLLELNGIVLPVGTHDFLAEFIGDATYYPATATLSKTVIADAGVQYGSFSLSPSTTFYPVKDGYRDTVSVRGSASESVTVTVRIYNGSGTRVRTISLGTKVGSWSTKWDGRTSSGTLVAAGTYKIRQTLVDSVGNNYSKDLFIKLSKRQVEWHTTTITKYGAAYGAITKDGTGSYSKTSSSYTNGVKLTGGSGSGYALARWSFTLRSALAYKGLKISVLGKGTRSSSRAILAFAQDSVGSIVGPDYKWWSRSGSVTGRINDRVVLLDVETDGPMSGAFDVAKTRVTYTYAVWP